MAASFAQVALLFIWLGAAPQGMNAAAAHPAIERDAKDALAQQCMELTPVRGNVPWYSCFKALDLATHNPADLLEARRVLSAGYSSAGGAGAKEPYFLPAASADVFWDWLAGANGCYQTGSTCYSAGKPFAKSKLKEALAEACALVDRYYSTNNRGLMLKVDANILAGNSRRAIFELLAYAVSEIDAAGIPYGDTRVVNALKVMDAVRLCYASGEKGTPAVSDYRKKLFDNVASKFRVVPDK